MTDDDLATAYVIGTLGADARQRVRIRMAEDQAFAAALQAWENRLAPLALAEEAELPADLLGKIEARIDAAGVELPGTITRRAGGEGWQDAGPGLKIKVMHVNEALKRHTFMAWLQPGAEYTDHDHDQDEEIYMIEGDLIIGGVELKAGDFHVARAGRHHPAHHTRSGCICIISQAIGAV